MTPQEVAMKFASASATCKGDKCPLRTTCTGRSETCGMKEVTMIIRSLLAEIETLQAENTLLHQTIENHLGYINALEDVNEKYYRLCVSFQQGRMMKSKVRRYKTKRAAPKPRRKKKDPVEMDGDPRYAAPPTKPRKPELPVVII